MATVTVKRDIFGELMEGVAAMKGRRAGKITLRTHKVETSPLPKVDSKLILDTRKKLRCSRAVFARRLRINERTLEKWEQGRETESSGGGSGATGAPVSGHAGTTGRSRGAVMDRESAQVLVFEETFPQSPVYLFVDKC